MTHRETIGMPSPSLPSSGGLFEVMEGTWSPSIPADQEDGGPLPRRQHTGKRVFWEGGCRLTGDAG